MGREPTGVQGMREAGSAMPNRFGTHLDGEEAPATDRAWRPTAPPPGGGSADRGGQRRPARPHSRRMWEVGYARDRDAGRPRYVDASRTRRRLVRLVEAGMPVRTLARVCRVSDTGLGLILAGERTWVQTRTAKAVAEVTLARVYASQTTGHLPRIGAVRRVEALLALGWPHPALAAAGVPHTAQLLAATDRNLITAQRWRAIAAVYDRLSMTQGPSARTLNAARDRGYAPPLAWDEDAIDDPHAQPCGVGHDQSDAQVMDLVAVRRALSGEAPSPALARPERKRVVEALAGAGFNDTEIATRVGASTRTIQRVRHERSAGATTRRALGVAR